jgi:hypothetical protein
MKNGNGSVILGVKGDGSTESKHCIGSRKESEARESRSKKGEGSFWRNSENEANLVVTLTVW